MTQGALVLEGGALRCLFTAGVLDIMLKQEIEMSCVMGVSAGSLSGVNYVAKQIGRTAKVNIHYMRDKRYFSAWNWLKQKGFFDFDFMFGELSENLLPLDYQTFEQSPQRFIAVATECKTGEPRYYEKGVCQDIYKAVRASSSIPLMEPIVEVDGEECVDGGVGMAIPYQKAIDDGYEKIVVVLTRDLTYRKKPYTPAVLKLYERVFREYPGMLEAIRTGPERYNRMVEEIVQLEKEGRIFVIRPEKPILISRMEKDRGKLRDLYREGRRVGKQQLEALKQYLEIQ